MRPRGNMPKEEGEAADRKMAGKETAGKEMAESRTAERETEYKISGELKKIRPLDQGAMETAKRRFDSIAKPLGSLGILETDLIRTAGIYEDSRGLAERLSKAALVIMCADHGVVEEGVTQTGQEVTRIVAENFANGSACASIMCREAGIDVFPVDMGMNCGTVGGRKLEPFCLYDSKVARGSRNLSKEPAMSLSECETAVCAGIRLAGALKEKGYGILLAGEMGIGNTTPASILASLLTGLPLEKAIGRGAGLSDEGLEKKKRAAERAVRRFASRYPKLMEDLGEGRKIRKEAGKEAAILLLSELGGYDLAGMAGLFLGGGIYRLPVVIDGSISATAALLADRMAGGIAEFLFPSHISTEPSGCAALEALGFHAPLDLGMHLGEGTGAALYIPLLRMGAAVYEKMSTFEEISVTPYVDYEGEKEIKP